jgi:hypothetical protein
VAESRKELRSAGHAIGQIIGDWFERYVVFTLLADVARSLGLDLRSRFAGGATSKIIWEDIDGNKVDYDFVLVLPGTEIPVAFYESFWRSGSRHSKDKARDDSTKLRPMMETYPTARALGIIAAGEFTGPAAEFIRSFGNITLFHVPKADIIEAWAEEGLVIDYPDRSSEAEKTAVLRPLARAEGNPSLMNLIAGNLFKIIGFSNITSLKAGIVAKLNSLPSSVAIVIQETSDPIVFTDFREAGKAIIDQPAPAFPDGQRSTLYGYAVSFTNGDLFERSDLTWGELQTLQKRLEALVNHVERIVEQSG